jgi:hypothetical protein
MSFGPEIVGCQLGRQLAVRLDGNEGRVPSFFISVTMTGLLNDKYLLNLAEKGLGQ